MKQLMRGFLLASLAVAAFGAANLPDDGAPAEIDHTDFNDDQAEVILSKLENTIDNDEPGYYCLDLEHPDVCEFTVPEDRITIEISAGYVNRDTHIELSRPVKRLAAGSVSRGLFNRKAGCCDGKNGKCA